MFQAAFARFFTAERMWQCCCTIPPENCLLEPLRSRPTQLYYKVSVTLSIALFIICA